MMESPSHIAIVILAAGASKRMGKPKQLLQWGETNLIGHTINTALEVNPKEIMVVLGAHFELIKTEVENSNVTIFNNPHWEKGLGTSIAFAIEHLQTSESNIDGVLIMLCDQPFVTSDFLKTMISDFKADTHQIMATSYGNGKCGVPALFDKTYFSELMALEDDYGAKYLLQKHQLNVETLVPPMDNMDLDTNEDYTNLYQSNFKK